MPPGWKTNVNTNILQYQNKRDLLQFANKILKEDQPSLVCNWLCFFNVVFYNIAFDTFTVACYFT